MIADYISDLHEDRDIFNLDISENTIIDFFGKLKPKGEILLVAGDTSEDNSRLIKTLDLIQKLYYQKVIFVLGNHELYSFSKFNYYTDKVNDLKKRLLDYPNLILLDGSIYTYKGISIGGTMMWYDGSYSKYVEFTERDCFDYGIDKFDLNKIWELTMPDFGNIPNYFHFKEMLFSEKKKLDSIYKKSDILLTHVSPLCHPRYVNDRFKNEILSSFFYFDGEKYISETSAKNWIFGHIHSPLEVSVSGIDFHCNPYGVMRKGFKREVFLKQIEL